MARTRDVPLSFTYFIGEREVTERPEEYLEAMSERLSESMSDYYSRHPEEYKALLENDERREERRKCKKK